jgi:hypothetical protein
VIEMIIFTATVKIAASAHRVLIASHPFAVDLTVLIAGEYIFGKQRHLQGLRNRMFDAKIFIFLTTVD